MLVSLDRKHSSVVEFYGNEASYISYTLETFNISNGISCHVLYMYMRMTCVGAQNVAQFQSTSRQSVTELHKEYKCYSIYSLFNRSLQQTLLYARVSVIIQSIKDESGQDWRGKCL